LQNRQNFARFCGNAESMRIHHSTQRVYFDDLDAAMILHNIRYLLFIERARTELFAELGISYTGTAPDRWNVIGHNAIRYLAPVRSDVPIVIHTHAVKLGQSSLVLRARVSDLPDSTTHAECETRIVRVDGSTFKACPWTGAFREAIAPYLEALPP
jgi:acyl-CoA thioester hydrolase